MKKGFVRRLRSRLQPGGLQDQGLPLVRILSKRFPLAVILLSALGMIFSAGILAGGSADRQGSRLVPAEAVKTAQYLNLAGTGRSQAFILIRSDRLLPEMDKVREVASALEASKAVKTVSWRPADEALTLLKSLYAGKAALLLSESETARFREKLSPRGMAQELDKLKRGKALPGSREMRDPLNLLELFLPHLGAAFGRFDPGTGLYLTPDRTSLVMAVSSSAPLDSDREKRAFIRALSAIADTFRSPAFSVETAGPLASELQASAAATRALIAACISFFAMLSALSILFLRSPKGVLYILTPVLPAVMMTLGLHLLITGRMPAMAGAAAALTALFGLGMALQFYTRFLANSGSAVDPAALVDKSIRQTAGPIASAALAGGALCLALLFSSFSALRELALLGGAGITLCYLFLFSVAALAVRPSSGSTLPQSRVERLRQASSRKQFFVSAAAGCLVLAAGALLLQFSPSRAVEVPGLAAERLAPAPAILKEAGLREPSLYVSEGSMELQSAVARSLEIKNTLLPFTEYLISAADLLPPDTIQRKTMAGLSGLLPGTVAVDFRRLAGERGFSADQFDEYLGWLDAMLRNRQLISLKEMTPLGAAFEQLLRYEDDQWTIVLAGAAGADQTALRLPGDINAAGPAIIRQELHDLSRHDALIIGLCALACLNAVLSLRMRSVADVLRCQVPAAAALVCSLALMALTGWEVSALNSAVLLILYGASALFSLHLQKSHQQGGAYEGRLPGPATAILMTGLTSSAALLPFLFVPTAGAAPVALIGLLLSTAAPLILTPFLQETGETSGV